MNYTTGERIKEYNLDLLDVLGYGYKNGYIPQPEGAEPGVRVVNVPKTTLLKISLQLPTLG